MDKRKVVLSEIERWIRRKVPVLFGIALPVSGGSDSALCWWLCNRALPGKVLGIFAGKDLRREDWFRKFGALRLIEAPTFTDSPEIARWSEFLTISIKENLVLFGTRNRTEDVLGTYSLASRLATVLPIAGLWKTDVINFCKSIGVPEEIIASSRRADPICGRPTELADIPIELVDAFLKRKKSGRNKEPNAKLSKAQKNYLEKIYADNRFKSLLPEKGPVLHPFRFSMI